MEHKLRDIGDKSENTSDTNRFTIRYPLRERYLL